MKLPILQKLLDLSLFGIIKSMNRLKLLLKQKKIFQKFSNLTFMLRLSHLINLYWLISMIIQLVFKKLLYLTNTVTCQLTISLLLMLMMVFVEVEKILIMLVITTKSDSLSSITKLELPLNYLSNSLLVWLCSWITSQFINQKLKVTLRLLLNLTPEITNSKSLVLV